MRCDEGTGSANEGGGLTELVNALLSVITEEPDESQAARLQCMAVRAMHRSACDSASSRRPSVVLCTLV